MWTGKALAKKQCVDTCKIAAWQAGSGRTPIGSHAAPGAELKCQLRATPNREVSDGSQTTIAEAEILIPSFPTLDAKDRIHVTKLHGTTLSSALVFAMLGDPLREDAGFRCNVRRVTGNSSL